MFYDKVLLDNYANADKVIKSFFFTTRRRGGLREVNDAVQ